MERNDKHKDTYLAKWLAGEITNNDLKDMVGEEDYRVYLKLKKGLEVKSQLDRPVEESFQKVQEKINRKKTKVISLKTKWAIGIAASILVIVAVFNFLKPSQNTFTTGFGEHKAFVLEDGSEVILNSRSSVTYTSKDWENNRELSLDGEAFFKVAKGKTFTVITPNGKVQVLGTQFDVNSTADFFDVTCYEGKVKVTTVDDIAHVLLPGQTIRKINGFETEALDSSDLEPTWIAGESTFKSVPLEYVIKALENEYNISIDASDIETATLYTGAFPHKNVEVALKTVFGSLDINYDFISQSNLKLSNSK